MSNIGFPGNADAIPAILKYIQSDPDPEVRHFCVYALNGVQDLEGYKAVGPLSAVLEETDQNTKMVRYSVARLLAGRLQARAPAKTADVLVTMLTDHNLFIYNGTDAKVKGVGTEGTAGGSETMQKLGEDGRYMGAEALGWMGAKANRPEVIQALQEAKQDKDANLRNKAAEAVCADQVKHLYQPEGSEKLERNPLTCASGWSVDASVKTAPPPPAIAPAAPATPRAAPCTSGTSHSRGNTATCRACSRAASSPRRTPGTSP